VEFHFDYNYKDIISVPAKALRAKKILLSSIFILIALILFNCCAYLGLIIEGYSIPDIYNNHGLLPIDNFALSSYPAILFYYYIGPFLALFSIMTGTMAVAVIDFEQLRGNPFLSYIQSIKFGLGRIRQLFLSELVIALFIALIVIMGIIVGLITRIPYIGELLYSVFFFFPNFIVALFTTLAIFIQLLSVLIMPAAVAADYKGETFRSIVETFLTITRQPVRWVGYTAYSIITAKVASFVFAYFAYRAVQLLQFMTGLGGGAKIDKIIASGISHLPLDSPVVQFIANLFPGINFGFEPLFPTQVTSESLAGYIMAISLFLIFLIIWGYVLSIVATGQAYAFAIIKKKRDNYKITDEDSLFFESAWVDRQTNSEDYSKQ